MPDLEKMRERETVEVGQSEIETQTVGMLQDVQISDKHRGIQCKNIKN